MTKDEILEKLRERAILVPITPGITDIVIRIYFEDDDYEEFYRWVKQEENSNER